MEIKIEEIENKPKRKQISYDDLLSNMGFKLNNGKLELYNKKIQENIQTHQQIKQAEIKQAQPMTKQQYKKLLQLQYIQNQRERERINNIKSKKLLFSNPSSIQNMNSSISIPNKFFHFSR
jgi:hypothetical protein